MLHSLQTVRFYIYLPYSYFQARKNFKSHAFSENVWIVERITSVLP